MRTRVQAGYVLLLAVLAGGIQCTAEGGGGEPCSRNLECIARSINTPICDGGKCRAGRDNDDCAKNAATTEAECTAQLVMSCPLKVVSGLWCDTKEGSRTQGSCGECIPDAICAADPSCQAARYSCGSSAMQLGYGSFCDPNTLRCGSCVQDSDCPAMSFCLVSTLTQRKVCGECRTKTDCPVSKPYCLPSATTGANACVECDLDSQCSAPKKYCRPDGNGNKTCVECQADADCSGSKPRCGVSQPDGIKMCGECTSDAQCSGSKPACDSKTLLCAACSPTFCAGKVASDGCRPDGTCGACSEHNQCASGVCYRPGDFAPPAAAAGLSPGQCVPSSMVKAVGTTTIGQELNPGTTPFLKLSPGTYPALTINREVVLVGATPLVQNLSTMSQTILSHLTLMGGRTVLYDVRAEANVDGKAVVACSGAAKLNARLVRILNGRLHRGIDASGSCSEVLLSQAFIQADWEAMVLNPAAANLLAKLSRYCSFTPL